MKGEPIRSDSHTFSSRQTAVSIMHRMAMLLPTPYSRRAAIPESQIQEAAVRIRVNTPAARSRDASAPAEESGSGRPGLGGTGFSGAFPSACSGRSGTGAVVCTGICAGSAVYV